MPIHIVVAIDKYGGMGKDNKLPWGKILLDMKRFRELTRGETVVMGRKTWDSLPDEYRPLPDRKRNIVLTRDKNFVAHGAHVVHHVDEVLAIAKNENIFVIGGAEIYAEFVSHASWIHLTIVDRKFDCDTQFPFYDVLGWEKITTIDIPKSELSPYDLKFILLARTTPLA